MYNATLKIMTKTIEFARMMRGRVPEWGDDYVEKHVPPDILARMMTEKEWVDEEGFTWGFRFVSANKDKINGYNICTLAKKYIGQGCSEIMFVREGSVLLEKRMKRSGH